MNQMNLELASILYDGVYKKTPPTAYSGFQWFGYNIAYFILFFNKKIFFAGILFLTDVGAGLCARPGKIFFSYGQNENSCFF